jgi:hypothetical protein
MVDVPDYSDEKETPSEDALLRLRRMAVKMVELQQELDAAESRTEQLKKERDRFSLDLIPTLMKDLGLLEIRLTTNFRVVVTEDLRVGAPSQEPEKKAAWMAYLKETGNDGLVKREVVVSYGRDSTAWAEQLIAKIKEMEVEKHAEVKQVETIHPQTLKAFVTREKMLHPEVIDLFGVFEQRVAKVKSK